MDALLKITAFDTSNCMNAVVLYDSKSAEVSKNAIIDVVQNRIHCKEGCRKV